MRKSKVNQKGFTLIELLAVIVILAILMTLAITSMQGYINGAKKDTYITTAQQFLQYVRLGITNGDYTSPVAGECTAIHISQIQTESGVIKSPFGKELVDAQSFILVYNSTTTGGDKLNYYAAMNDTQGNGFTLAEENSLNRNIVKVRKEGGFAGTTLPSKVASTAEANFTLVKDAKAAASEPVPKCKLTTIDG